MSPVPGPVSPRPGLKRDLRRIGQSAVREHMRANARPIAATDNYGWTFDPGASEHASLCPWVIPTGTTVAEVARPPADETSDDGGTYSDSPAIFGLEIVSAACTCGLYRNVTLRAETTFDGVLCGIFLGDQPPTAHRSTEI